MWKRIAIILAFAGLAGSAAVACPPVNTAVAQRLEPLFGTLTAAQSEAEGQSIESQIWRVWTMAPDTRAQKLLDEGMQRIRWADPERARGILDELVAYCPAYPEGWNQRAFARFLTGDYDGALEDLDRTLSLEPRHFGALAGKALTLLRQGRGMLAQQALSQAVSLHPWLKERHLLAPARDL